MTYKKRYTDKQKQYAYENACDCLIYGYGKEVWNTCNIKDQKELNDIWNKAIKDLSEF